MIVGNSDFINLSGDESAGFMYKNMLNDSVISDVYKIANVPEGTYVSNIEFDESTNTFTFTFSDGSKFTAKVSSNGEVDLSSYVKKSELEDSIKEFQTAEQVDSRVKSIIGSAPEALDTLQELSAALGDDPNFATTVANKLSDTDKKIESVRSEIPSIDGLATKDELSNSIKGSVKYKDFIHEGQSRKTIQLENYDSISGLMTNGTGVNLAMVSKWDKADYGSSSLPMNLNSKGGVVTINDTDEVAVKSDIPSIDNLATKDEVEEIKNSVKTYTSGEGVDINSNNQVSVKINQRERHINISPDGGLQFSYSFKKVAPWHYQFLDKNNAQVSSIDSIDFNTEYDSLSEMVRARAFTVDLEKEVSRATKKESELEGKVEIKANLSDIPKKLPNPNALSIKVNGSEVASYDGSEAKEANISLNANSLEGLDDKLSVYATKKELEDAVISGGQVDLTDYAKKSEVESIKSTVDTLMSGNAAETIDNFNEVKSFLDGIGDTEKLKSMIDTINNNANRIESKIPTWGDVEEKVTSEGGAVDSWVDNKIQSRSYATEEYVSESIANSALISMLTDRLNALEDSVSSLKKTDIEIVTPQSGQPIQVTQSKDAIISGDIDTTSDIKAKSVSFSNVSITNNARLKTSTTKSGDVDIKSMKVTGDFPKSDGNAVISINDSGYVTIKDTVVNANLYNCIEIGLDGTELPSGVLIENCRFEGTFANNAISIFGTKDNAVININNCYFENVSNCIRLSNRTNSKCTVNISNCKCDHWDTNQLWSGMLICQDYTSKSKEECESNDLFSKSKITINISNFTKPDGSKLKSNSNLSSICGTANSNQVFYLWNELENTVPYGDGSRYPTINIL